MKRAPASGLVSVVIPCRDQAPFLAEAIESALAQTYDPVEVVVVDDGSTDGTPDVASRYPGVRCLRREGIGVASARNAGLREARGEFVVFLDADDRLRPGAVAVGVRHLRAHPACAFVSGHHVRIAVDGSQLESPAACRVEHDFYPKLLARREYGIPTPACVVYRRGAVESVGGFRPELVPCEDYDLNLRIAREFRVLCHDEIVVEYRRHPDSLSRRPDVMLRSILAVLRAQRPYVAADPALRAPYAEGMRFWKRYYGTRIVAMLPRQLRQGQWSAAARSLLTLVRHHPLGLRYAVPGAGRAER